MGIKPNGRGSSPSVPAKMQLKWSLFFFGVVAAAGAASIFHGEIPVKVIYDQEITHRLYVRNLDKKAQEEVRKLVPSPTEEAKKEAEPSGVYVKALGNHAEKLQLSQKELAEVGRHVPLEKGEEDPPRKLRIVTPPEAPIAKPGEFEDNDKLFEKIQEIINNGVQRIKSDVKSTQQVVQPEVWTSLNDGVNDFLQSIRSKNSLRQSSNSSSIIEQFQNFASNFFGQLTGQNPNASQDAQQPTFPQNVVGLIQNGFSQMQQGLASVLSGQQRPPTILGDNPSTPSPNPLQGFVQQAQNTLNSIFNPQQNPGDLASSSPNPIQSISNSIGQAFQNLNPFNNRPGGAGDETSTQGGPLQAFQNALNNLNPFQQTTAKPTDTSSSNPLINPIGLNTTLPVGEQIAGAISNPAGAVSSLIGSNPLQPGNNPVQGIAQQISAAIPSNPIEGVVQQVAGSIP